MDKTPSLALPVSSLSPPQQGLVQSFLQQQQQKLAQASSGGGALLQDGLDRFEGAKVEFWSFNTGRDQVLHMTARFPGMDWAPDFPIVISGTAAGLRADAKKGETDALGSPSPPQSSGRSGGEAAPGAPSPAAKARVTLDLAEAEYSEAVVALAEAAHVNVIADAFTLRERLTAHPKDARLGQVLDRLRDTFDVRREWDGNTLFIRSEKWEDRLEQEPPAFVLDRLVEAVRKNPFLAARELALAASRLAPAQIGGLANWHDAKRNLAAEAASLRSNYKVYAWAGLLNDAQWAQLARSGLPLNSLNARQRMALIQLALACGEDAGLLQQASVIAWREAQWTYPPPINLELRRGAGTVLTTLR
ncbi:MAG: hypothetical protein C4321_07270 [Chloroflexota bacterium]